MAADNPIALSMIVALLFCAAEFDPNAYAHFENLHASLKLFLRGMAPGWERNDDARSLFFLLFSFPLALSLVAYSLFAGYARVLNRNETASFTLTSAAQQELVGHASWYGLRFHGRVTSNGEIFSRHKLTAAHRTLPVGANVRVTNIENGKSVRVRINDRGPFVRGRIIDLSSAAARAIGLLKPGTAPVRLELIDNVP